MARLSTVGFDIEASGELDALAPVGTVTRDTTLVRARSGPASIKCDSAAGNAAANIVIPNQAAGAAGSSFATSGVTYFCRIYFCFTNLPTADTDLIRYISGTVNMGVRLRTSGKIALWNNQASAQIGSDSVSIVLADAQTWYRIEFLVTRTGTTTVGTCTVLLDGTQVASGSATGTATSGSGGFANVGWVTAPGANKVLHMDDCAVNDNTGSAQTSYPGAGNILVLLPVSDNARGANWVAGAGATTNLWDALDNTPPVGVALASATNTSQIKNVTSDTTGNYDANVTDYATAGLTALDTITLVHPLWAIGSSAAGAVSHAMLLVSNPQANSGTATTATPAAIAGTYRTNWVGQGPAAQIVYTPSVTLGTQPVIRVGKRTATTSAAMACFMGVYVEFVPPPSFVFGSQRRAINSIQRRTREIR